MSQEKRAATLYLHIGTPKTGTTAIQWFCRANRAALEREGCCFPKMPYFYPSASSERNGHFLIFHPHNPDGSLASARGEREWRRCMDHISAQFRKTPNVILSDESIWYSSTEGLWKRLKAEAQERGFDLRLIVYIRRQDQHVVSGWAQGVKSPSTDRRDWKLEQMLANAEPIMRLDYYAALEAIAAQLGRECISVRVYERKNFPEGDIVRDFLQLLGLPFRPDFKLPSDRNSSLYGDTLEIRRIINSVPGIDAEQQLRITKIARICCNMDDGPKPSMFTQEECEAFLRDYEESNRLLARDYLGTDAPLFPAPKVTAPKWTPDSPEMYEHIIRFFAIAAFVKPRSRFVPRLRHQLRRLKCLAWEARERLRSRLER